MYDKHGDVSYNSVGQNQGFVIQLYDVSKVLSYIFVRQNRGFVIQNSDECHNNTYWKKFSNLMDNNNFDSFKYNTFN